MNIDNRQMANTRNATHRKMLKIQIAIKLKSTKNEDTNAKNPMA